jgi:ribosomal protein S18 acetylase RimI-like enzyme
MLAVEKTPVIAPPALPIDRKVDFRIRQVTADDVQGIDYITELHMDLLKFGPMAQFGDAVIRETIYIPALRDKLLEIAVAEVDGRPAGFVAYTEHAHVFHQSLLRNHLLKALWVTGWSLLTRPARFRHVPRALKVIFSRNELPENLRQRDTEVVCFGVRPEFLTPEFVRQHKLRIGEKLLDHAADYFKAKGLTNMHMIVDGDNPRALLFYQSQGAELVPCVFGGIPSYFVLFDNI